MRHPHSLFPIRVITSTLAVKLVLCFGSKPVSAQNFMSEYHLCDSLFQAQNFTDAVGVCERTDQLGANDAGIADSFKLFTKMMLAFSYQETENFALATAAFHDAAQLNLASAGYDANYEWIQSQLVSIGLIQKNEDLIISACNEVIKSIELSKGKDSPDQIFYLYSAAEEYLLTGQYALAQQYFSRAGELYLKSSPPDADYARILVELSSVYLTLGKYADCIQTNQQALAVLGTDTADHYDIFSDAFQLLSWSYYRADSVETAFDYILKIIDISSYQQPMQRAGTLVSATLFIVNADIAYGTHNAKEYHLEQALYQALDIYDSLQPDAVFINNVYLAFGNYFVNEGMNDSAAVYYKKAADLVSNAYGKNNIIYLNALASLARTCEFGSNPMQAAPVYDSLIALGKKFLSSNFIFLSESEQESVIKSFEENRNYFYGFYSRHPEVSRDGASVFYDTELFMKGLLLQNITSIRNTILDGADEEAQATFNQWLELKKTVSAMYLNRQPGTEALQKQIEALELELRRQHADIVPAEVSWRTIRDHLEKDEAAIEMLNFNDDTGDVYYASLIRKNDSVPILIRLFRAEDIEFLSRRTGETDASYLQRIYTFPDLNFPDDTSFYDGDKMYRLIWSPMEKYLSQVHHIWLAPTGVLNQIAFNAIPLNADSILLDKYSIANVSSTKSILNAENSEKFKRFQLAGGINYGRDPDNENAEYWRALPGTFTEIQSIAEQVTGAHREVAVVSGDSVTENYFRSIDRSKTDLIHLATHGYFFDEADRSDSISAGMRFKSSANPLVRTGIILSNGNSAWKNNSNISTTHDGILTAEEISNMNLSGVRLVVLSACESGLGDIKGTEGVYGLQRAFKMAGVNNMVISLWQVPDNYTSELMDLFYSNLLKSGDPQSALRNAQLILSKKTGVYNWAAFVVIE